MVIVGEGEEQVDFAVHQRIICDHSSFFKTACSTQWAQWAQWAEGRAKTIELPHQSSAAFELYLKWVYSAMSDFMATVHEHWESSAEFLEQDSSQQRCTICLCLVQMWILADYLDDSACKGKIMDSLVCENRANRIPAMIGEQYKEFYAMVYSETTPDAEIRIWLVHHTLAHLNREVFERLSSAFPQEMVTNMFKALMDQKAQAERKGVLKMSPGSKWFK